MWLVAIEELNFKFHLILISQKLKLASCGSQLSYWEEHGSRGSNLSALLNCIDWPGFLWPVQDFPIPFNMV